VLFQEPAEGHPGILFTDQSEESIKAKIEWISQENGASSNILHIASQDSDQPITVRIEGNLRVCSGDLTSEISDGQLKICSGDLTFEISGGQLKICSGDLTFEISGGQLKINDKVIAIDKLST
jgi:hypothetical protein